MLKRLCLQKNWRLVWTLWSLYKSTCELSVNKKSAAWRCACVCVRACTFCIIICVSVCVRVCVSVLLRFVMVCVCAYSRLCCVTVCMCVRAFGLCDGVHVWVCVPDIALHDGVRVRTPFSAAWHCTYAYVTVCVRLCVCVRVSGLRNGVSVCVRAFALRNGLRVRVRVCARSHISENFYWSWCSSRLSSWTSLVLPLYEWYPFCFR